MSEQDKPPKPFRPSPHMRAIFREVARDIVGKDRDARKYGRTQNTVGEIERAMVKAYMLGQEPLSKGIKVLASTQEEPIDWLEIPPRARQTLISMTISFSKSFSTPISGGLAKTSTITPDEIETFFQAGRKRWALVIGDQRREQSVADRSVAPLIRLGLLAPRPDYEGRYMLTDYGLMACKDYWCRHDANDPTLPRQSIR